MSLKHIYPVCFWFPIILVFLVPPLSRVVRTVLCHCLQKATKKKILIVSYFISLNTLARSVCKCGKNLFENGKLASGGETCKVHRHMWGWTSRGLFSNLLKGIWAATFSMDTITFDSHRVTNKIVQLFNMAYRQLKLLICL